MGDVSQKIARRCWANEGIWGDASCPEFAKVGHCHNCPVYETAGQLFAERNGELSQSNLAAKTAKMRTLAESAPAENKKASREFPYLLFKCGALNFALPMNVVLEVANSRPIHKLPHRCDKVVAGLVNINGELLIAVDILSLLKSGESKRDNCRMIVCVFGDDKFAFNADSVWGMARVSADAVSRAAAEDSMSGFVENSVSVNGQKYLLVDFELIAHAITRNYL